MNYSGHFCLGNIVHFGYVYSHQSRKLAGGADPSPLIRELSLLTTQNIDNSLIFGGDLDRASDIMAAIVQHNGQTDSLDMTREDVEVTIMCWKDIHTINDLIDAHSYINVSCVTPDPYL